VRRILAGASLLAAVALAASTARAADPAPAPPASPGARPGAPAASPEARRQKARDYFTDTLLVNQDGRSVRFFSDALDGKVVLVSFIFTRCVEACPLICQKMNGVRRALGDRFREVQFVSLSVDPDFDTPAELAYFAKKQEARYPNWTFLSGKRENVSLVGRRLGEWPDEPGNHTTAFLAGNVRTGHWTKIRPDMPAAAIADTLRRLADEDTGHGDASPTPRAAN
jgi:protein SCO1